MANSTIDAMDAATPATGGNVYISQSGADKKLAVSAAGAEIIEAANAGAQRAALGGTTAGQALLTLTNPGAISFLRVNADNTVTALSAADFKSALAPTFADIAAGILAGNMTLGESTGQILLDPALSADGKWSGICEAGTAGATLAFGDLCYFAAADSRWELTDASAAATAGDVQLGVCVLAAAADGDPTMMLRIGKVRADTAFPTFTVGAPVYVSETAGDVTETAPVTTDSVMRRIGFAVTADSIYFAPSPDYLTHT